MPMFSLFLKHGLIFFWGGGGVILPTVERYLLCIRKSSEFYLVHGPELHVEVYLKNYRFLSVPCQYYLLMTLVS